MRRGLIAWSKDEVPVAVLDGRRARLQAAMRARGIDAVLIHTCFPRPAAVSYLTHFVPYWSEALLIVLPDGLPALLASLTKRVHGWIREVSHMGEIVAAPHLGRAAAQFLAGSLRPVGRPRIGVVELPGFARSHAAPIAEAFGAEALEDASGLFAEIRQPTDAAELALAATAAAIAGDSLAAAPADAGRAGDLAAAIDRAARSCGAEECLVLIAPDLAASPALRRVEDSPPLAGRYAVQVSTAYKATWVRILRSQARDGGAPDAWHTAEDWLDRAIPNLVAADMARWPESAAPPGRLDDWTVEASVGAAPLSVVAAKDRPARFALPPGTLSVLSVRLETADGPWVRGLPVVLGDGAAAPGRRLVLGRGSPYR